MELFLLYLWTRLDTFNLVLGFTTVLLGAALPVVTVLLTTAEEWNKSDPLYQLFVKYKSAMYKWFFLLLFLVIAIPSQKDATMLAGGWLANEILTDPKTKVVGDKVYQLINKKLDEQLQTEQ